jgi:plastocyanin
MIKAISIVFLGVQCVIALPLTQLVGSSFRVPTGASISVSNAGASDYLLDVSSYGGTASEADPTLILTVGETYQFTRVTSGHNFALVNGSLPIAENLNGSLYRTVTDSSLDNYDITEGISGNGSANVTWTPVASGVYYYTCDVTSHQQMVGKLIVVPARNYADAFEIESGTAISVANSGLSHYLLDLSSHGGTSTEADPTLILTAGETYQFLRVTSGHNFALVNGSLPVATNPDGSLYRTVTDSSLDNYDITENISGNSSSNVSWTPTETGIYYYTCDVTGHSQMIGKIVVISSPTLGAVQISNSSLQVTVTDVFTNRLVYVETSADLNEATSFGRTHLYVAEGDPIQLTLDAVDETGFYRVVSEEY